MRPECSLITRVRARGGTGLHLAAKAVQQKPWGPDKKACFTPGAGSVLVLGMDREQIEEAAFFDYMEARERALEAAIGTFTVCNVPTPYLRHMVEQGTSRDLIVFAAQIVLHSRGENWRACGPVGSEAQK